MTTARISKLILVDAVGIRPGGREDRDIADVFALGAADLAKLMWHDPANAPDPADMSDDQIEVVIANRTALAMYTWDPYMHDPRLKHRLHRIDVPTLLIWGANDRSAPLPKGLELFERIALKTPESELHLLNGAGHYTFRDQYEAFNQVVRDFCLA